MHRLSKVKSLHKLLIGSILILSISMKAFGYKEIFGTNVLVKVFFKDKSQANDIAASFEPFESNYEKGYLILIVSSEQIKLLEKAKIKFEYDFDTMNKFKKNKLGTDPNSMN